MNAHNARRALFLARKTMPDPGNAGTIVCSHDGVICNLTSTAAQTRTLAVPTRQGAKIRLHFSTDGGDITLTVASAYNEVGATTYVFTEVGQHIDFESFMTAAGVFFWRKVGDDKTGNYSPGAQILTTTKTITHGENGTTFFINLAAGFVITLPTPLLGLKYKFVVMLSLTGSATIVTSSAANILCGQVLTVDVNSATDPDFTATADQDTITLVLNKCVKGDQVELECDGTSWYALCTASVFDAITIDQAA